MKTTKVQASGRRPSVGVKQKQRPLLPEGMKINIALTGEELMLAKQLARVLAQPGQILSQQDVLRIALANLGLQNAGKLAVGTDKQTS